jgi:hydrogenase nickel incorporation protein HypB
MLVVLTYTVESEPGEIFDIELDENLKRANDQIAEENQRLLQKHGVQAIDIMGSIGSGKTSLIEHLVRQLRDKYRIAAFKGDLTSRIDAERISGLGVQSVQINTGRECHLDANLVRKALAKIDLNTLDILFIENVGNLICPADFPLGSSKRVVVVSVTEGPYMVVKHPFIFAEADVAVINKIDLASQMNVDIRKLANDVHTINAKTSVTFTNCRTGEGADKVCLALGLTPTS